MRLSGSFATLAAVNDLRALGESADLLREVDSLRDARLAAPGVVHVTYRPRTVLGAIPLTTTITTIAEEETIQDGACVHLRVVGRRGVQSVDADLSIAMQRSRAETEVQWHADVVVCGNLASVGQRVAHDIITRAINDVLMAAAAAARQIDGENSR